MYGRRSGLLFACNRTLGQRVAAAGQLGGGEEMSEGIAMTAALQGLHMSNCRHICKFLVLKWDAGSGCLLGVSHKLLK
jgi:hypothetical protein